MSMSEIAAIAHTSPNLDRQQAIEATGIPEGAIQSLAGKGINTVGALIDTDAFQTVVSGRYDISTVQAVNGIPISAFRWLLDEIATQDGAVPAYAM